jgi:isopentenyldiphosphate isomerase
MSDQQITLVNDQDEIIGQKARSTITKDDIYRVSAAWIMNTKGEILLSQRQLTKKHDPGKWGTAVAGTVESGETYLENIIKEAEEELGLPNVEPVPLLKHRFSDDYNYFC